MAGELSVIEVAGMTDTELLEKLKQGLACSLERCENLIAVYMFIEKWHKILKGFEETEK